MLEPGQPSPLFPPSIVRMSAPLLASLFRTPFKQHLKLFSTGGVIFLVGGGFMPPRLCFQHTSEPAYAI